MGAKKSEGRQVREAFDGPKVEHDALMAEIEARAREQHSRSSDASESAAKVATFIEKTGLNTQAYSWASTIVKKLPKKDGQAKAMDIIRSLKTILPMIEAHVAGQGTGEMNLGEPEAADEPAGEVTDDPEDDAMQTSGEAEPEAVDPVEPVSGTVTPINFGGQAG